METRFIHFTQKAQANPRERFSSLMGLLSDEAGLLASFERLDAKKAPGIDGMRKAEYAEGVEQRSPDVWRPRVCASWDTGPSQSGGSTFPSSAGEPDR